MLYVLRPDTESAIAEIAFEDVFPVALGQVAFDTTDNDPPILKTQVTFRYTDFEVTLVA
jgi:hypothetical protein